MRNFIPRTNVNGLGFASQILSLTVRNRGFLAPLTIFCLLLPIPNATYAQKNSLASSIEPDAVNAGDSWSVAPIRRNRTAAPVSQVDWTTMASSYSHDETGQRVDQFVPGVQPAVEIRPDYVKSGFRHTRSTLQAGFSSDNYHMVEQWGGNVRPYGEWRYPNRPFAVPYGAWGPQLPQVFGGANVFGYPAPWNGWGASGPMGASNNFGAAPGFPPSFPAGPNFPAQNLPWGPTQGGAFGVGPWNALTPTQDDYYPQAPTLQPPATTPFRHSFGLE